MPYKEPGTSPNMLPRSSLLAVAPPSTLSTDSFHQDVLPPSPTASPSRPIASLLREADHTTPALAALRHSLPLMPGPPRCRTPSARSRQPLFPPSPPATPRFESHADALWASDRKQLAEYRAKIHEIQAAIARGPQTVTNLCRRYDSPVMPDMPSAHHE